MNWTFSALHQKSFSFLDFYVISYSTFITTHQNGFSNFYKRYNQKLIKPVKWNHEPKSKICFSKANCGVHGDGERAWSWCHGFVTLVPCWLALGIHKIYFLAIFRFFLRAFHRRNNLLQWISITWADFLRHFNYHRGLIYFCQGGNRNQSVSASWKLNSVNVNEAGEWNNFVL